MPEPDPLQNLDALAFEQIRLLFCEPLEQVTAVSTDRFG
jgi:hypothetical protein